MYMYIDANTRMTHTSMFYQAFATELEKSTRKKTSKSDVTVNYQTISESVRNIARASLNLTEFELDEFFQDTEVNISC